MNPVARAAHVPLDDVGQHAVQIVAHELVVACVIEQRAHGFKEPERRVNRVVFGRIIRVGKAIRQHAAIHVARKLREDAAGDIESAL